MKLETKNYSNELKDKDYANYQIKRHAQKMNMKQPFEAYEIVAQCIKKSVPDIEHSKLLMICLGTRNNHERDCFSLLFPNFEVKSLDISPLSKADYIMDFTNFSKDWENTYDIIYSNSIDHSFSATKTFDQWLKLIKTGGILVLSFSYNHSVSETDICSFDEKNVESFLNQRVDIQILDNSMGLCKNSSTWIIKKI